MMAYVFQAALLCEGCGDKVRAELTAEGKAPANPDDEHTYDSDDFPKGPFPEGGGEADTPHHCDKCGEFLENPLTDEGVKYVEEACREALEGDETDSIALDVWAPFYEISLEPDDEDEDENFGECPNCHNGTVGFESGRLVCRGECGAFIDRREGYCDACKPKHHDCCSLTPGCPCCEETMKSK